VRGLAIPIVSSCTTLAVMSAVPIKQSGLASGTLGMARNIGTAFGIAVLSQVYLFHMNTTLPSSLATSRAAADQFIVSGEGASRRLIEGVILQGFKLTALTCLVLCGSAAVLAFFLRTRVRKKGSIDPVQKEEQRLPVSPDG
jgi:MFS transporter, DHA2 family, methylenomycin A resistance protein